MTQKSLFKGSLVAAGLLALLPVCALASGTGAPNGGSTTDASATATTSVLNEVSTTFTVTAPTGAEFVSGILELYSPGGVTFTLGGAGQSLAFGQK